MDCNNCREAISAAIDGEASTVESEASTIHLSGCAECAAWRASAEALVRATRLSPADPVPDLTAAILSGSPVAPTLDPLPVARVGLGLVALAQVLVGLGSLFDAGHLNREHGVWEVALAIGFVTAAWRPRRAAGLVPLVTALVLGLLVTASVDAAEGTVGLLAEGNHLVPVVGLALLVVSTRAPRLVVR